MPNYAAIGRSGALRNITGDLLNVAALIRQEKALNMQQETHDIAMSEHQYKVDERDIRDKMTTDLGPAITNRGSAVSMENAIQSHKLMAADNEERAAIEQEKADEMQVQDVDSLQLMKDFDEAELTSAKKDLREWGMKNGLVQQVGGRMVISNKNKQIGMEMLAQDFKFKMIMNKSALLDTSTQKNQIKKELADMKEKGKGAEDKKYQELQAKLEKKEKMEAGFLSTINLLDDEIRRKKALQGEKSLTPSNKNYVNAAGDTLNVNVNDPDAVKAARAAGYRPYVAKGKDGSDRRLWMESASKELNIQYGKLTDEGYVINKDSIELRNRINLLLQKYYKAGYNPKEAASRAITEATGDKLSEDATERLRSGVSRNKDKGLRSRGLTKKGRPTWGEFLPAAQKVNPTLSVAQLKKEYLNAYGK